MPTRRLDTRAKASANARGRKAAPQHTIDLALQGGGSHGAFTWGVLDRLLDEPWLHFDGASGTSAGALNAAVMATGLAQGGRAGAQAALRRFWEGVAASGACFGRAGSGAAAGGGSGGQGSGQGGGQGSAPNPFTAWQALWGAAPLAWNPAAWWLGELTRRFSPYQFNPLNLNPLRELVRQHVDVAALRRGELSVFVNATAVHTGRPRIFRREELSHEALLASCCLPQYFQAVVIEGEPYWDGGYSGNPPLWPLIYETAALDLVLVKIDPVTRLGTPDTVPEIRERLNEINFNAGLAGEMRAIAFVQKLHEEGRLDSGQYKHLRLHMVADDAVFEPLPASSKLDTRRSFLLELHRLGRGAAERWLATDALALGQRSTLDVRRVFLGEEGRVEKGLGESGAAGRPSAGARRTRRRS